MLQLETWKPYPHSPRYDVSDEGRVRIHLKNKTRIVNPICHKGYMQINIDSKSKSLRRIVWETFKGDIPEGFTVASKNGFRTICNIDSLELVSKEEERSRRRRGKACKPVINLDTGEIYRSRNEAAKKLYLDRTAVGKYCRGERKKRTYNLRYLEEK